MSETERVADGLRVLELGSSVSVAVAGMACADAGAEVMIVEPPGGSPLREQPAFAMWGRGKQSTVADLREAGGRQRVLDLAREADVVLVGLKPASVERFDLVDAVLRADNPRLVHGVLSGFGSRGPYRDIPVTDGVMAARGGRMHDFSVLANGERPVFAAVPVIAHGAAMLLLEGVFSALRERERTGRGQLVETSMAQSLGVYDLINWYPGATREISLADTPFVPYSVARTADGVWVQFAQNGPVLLETFFRVLGLDGDVDYTTALGRSDPEALRALRAQVLEQMGAKSWAEWQEIFDGERNISAERFWAPGEALEHPQLRATGDAIDVSDPELGDTVQLGPLVEYPALPSRPSGPAPALGGAGDGGFRSAPLPVAKGGATPEPGGLLAGVTVLEVATWIATPFAGSLLRDLGARVIKVEPLTGDPMRAPGPVGFKMTQGKESIALDLKDPAGLDIALRLVERADVLMHNYRPGVPDRLGIDFESLRERNPNLVYLYNGSYGSTGPKAFAAAFHVTGGAVCGGARAQAGAGAPPRPDAQLSIEETARAARVLERCNESNPDFNSAITAAAALAMGLYSRERRGEGLQLETRMMLSNCYTMSADFIEYPGRPERTLPDAERLGLGPLYRLYPAREGWVFLSVASQRDFQRLCEGLGTAGLAGDPRFADPAARDANADALTAQLSEAFAARDAEAWETHLTPMGVACVTAYPGAYPSWLFEQPWAREQEFVVDVDASEAGAYTRYGPTVTCERPAAAGGSWGVGENSRAILAELGFGEAEVADLFAKGIVTEPGA